jgi:hypothetical protein
MMSTNRFFSWIIVTAVLGMLPFVVRFFRKPKQLEMPVVDKEALWNKAVKRRESLANKTVHQEKMKYEEIASAGVSIPFPQDLLFLDALKVSPDMQKIAISGGTFPHCKIYIGNFPATSEKEYSLVADLPYAYGVYPISWSPDSQSICYLVFEKKSDDSASASLCRYNIKSKETKIISVIRKDSEFADGFIDFMRSGTGSGFYIFCSDNQNVILFEKDKITFYTVSGQCVKSIPVKGIAPKRIAFVAQNDTEIVVIHTNISFLNFKQVDSKIGEHTSIIRTHILESTIDIHSGKVADSDFCPAVEDMIFVSGNENRCVGDLMPYKNQYRILRIDKDRPYERTMILLSKEVPDASLFVNDITANGQFVLCVMKQKDYLKNKRLNTHRPSSPAFQLVAVPINT